MIEGVSKGNASQDGAKRRGWFIGHYINDSAFRQTHDVEVKWGIHRPGDRNGTFAADRVARSMSVLIRGSFKLIFRRGEVLEEIILEKEGDYALWLPGVEHSWVNESSEETVILTVRWPSIPLPQVEQK